MRHDYDCSLDSSRTSPKAYREEDCPCANEDLVIVLFEEL